MKFQLKGTELHDVLSTVIKGFNSKEDNSYVAFELDDENSLLNVTARSRAAFFEGKIKAHSIEISEDEPKVYHLDGVKLRQLVSILPSAPVNVSFEINDETRSFTIKTMVSKYKLPVLSETPLAAAPNVEELATVDANEFMKAVKDLIKIVSTDPSTQEHQISCMHFNIKDEKIKLTATDSYALGSISIDSSAINLEDEESKDVLIRHTEVNTLIDNFSPGETLTIVGSDDMFGYINENGTLSLVGVINMPPLDTSQIEAITKDDNTVVLDKNELKTAIETVAKLSPHDETVSIELNEDRNEVRVSNRYGDYIDVDSIESKLDSPGIASFATSILLKSINPANNGPLRLEFGDLSDSSPGAARIVSLLADGSDDEEKSLLAIIMEK